MLRRKHLVVVGLTTFNTEMLKISVSAIARIKSKFWLIIHNDNPKDTVTKRDIRRLGYHGKLHIINSPETVGLRRARLSILDTAGKYASKAQWIIYVNDDDILLNTDIPAVSDNNFAVLHSNLVVRRRVSDLITAVTHPEKILPDGKNVILTRPSVGLTGTAIRMDIMRGMANIMHAAATNLDSIDAQLGAHAPVDTVMWMMLNKYARATRPDAVPIFMDSVNYIRNGIGVGVGRRMAAVMAAYDAAIAAAMVAY